ncbi:MAG: hypothetical protein HYR60_05570 [Acidobacteria bacterium]|nr:hypothetical protein [Acidobacteriota bacterium]
MFTNAPALKLSVVLLAAASASRSSANTLFFEDFEAYAPGSFLVGQGGWIRNPAASGPGNVRISASAHLPTHVLDGTPTDTLQQVLWHDLSSALDPSLTTVLSFDAYAPSLASHNSGIVLIGGGSRIGWYINIATNAWEFYESAGSFHAWDIPGGVAANYFRPIHFQIVFDGAADQVYGRYDLGAGFLETAHFALTDSVHSALSRVELLEDFRGTYGAEIDNILVATQGASVPEPASLAFVITSLVCCALGRVRWRSRRSA